MTQAECFGLNLSLKEWPYRAHLTAVHCFCPKRPNQFKSLSHSCCHIMVTAHIPQWPVRCLVRLINDHQQVSLNSVHTLGFLAMLTHTVHWLMIQQFNFSRNLQCLMPLSKNSNPKQWTPKSQGLFLFKALFHWKLNKPKNNFRK